MPTHIPRTAIILSIVLIAMLLLAVTVTQTNSLGAQTTVPLCSNPNAYLELSVEPSIALTDTLVTLRIAYHYIGLPYTAIQINPSGLVVFEPPLSMPCKYNQHINGCKSITMRTLATGVVQFSAGATGEAYDETCHCFCWGGATDNGPATLIIAESVWKMFLPSIHQ